MGRSVVAIGASKDDDAIWGLATGTPGCRLARSGTGGGGINALSLRTVGMLDVVRVEDEGAARWALFGAGNAGGTSSSPAVLDPSSSSSVNDPGIVVRVDGGGGTAASRENQLRRYDMASWMTKTVVLYVQVHDSSRGYTSSPL